MLAELAAANAAFSVIKSFVSNGKELTGCAIEYHTLKHSHTNTHSLVILFSVRNYYTLVAWKEAVHGCTHLTITLYWFLYGIRCSA